MKKITMATGLLFRYMTTKIHYIHKIIGKYVNEQLITYPHYKKEKRKTLKKKNNSIIKDRRIHKPKNIVWVVAN